MTLPASGPTHTQLAPPPPRCADGGTAVLFVCRVQGVYFTLDAIYAIQEYGEGFHQLVNVPLWDYI